MMNIELLINFFCAGAQQLNLIGHLIVTARFRINKKKKKMEINNTDFNSFAEVENIKEALSQLLTHSTVEEFAQVWGEIGLEAHHRKDRRTSIVQHIGELLEEMLNEEKVLKERMVESVRTCIQEMDQLEAELKLSTSVRTNSSVFVTLVVELCSQVSIYKEVIF